MVDSYVSDPNPFNPDVPDSIRQRDPELYRFLLDQAETLRRVHRESQATITDLEAQLAAAQSTLGGLGTAQDGTQTLVGNLTTKLGQLDTLSLSLLGLENRIDVQTTSAQFNITSLSTRIARISDLAASLDFTDSLQVMANYAALAGTAADNANGAAARGFIQAQATNDFTRQAKVYRDQAGVYADSTATLSLQAQVSSDQASINATLTETYKTSASTSAAEALHSAELAAEYAAEAGSGSPDLTALTARVTATESAIATETSARASADTTFSAQFAGSSSSGLKTSIDAEVTNRTSAIATAIASEVTRVDGIFASYSTTSGMNSAITAAVSAEVTNRNSAISTAVLAEASRIDSVVANYSTTTAMNSAISSAVTTAVASETSARVSADNTFTAQLAGTSSSGLLTSINAVSTAQSSTATSLTTLSATVGGHTSTLSTQAGAITTLNGRTSAYFTIDAIAGSRASLTVHADGASGGVDIGGNLTIDGDVILTGTHRIVLNTGTVMRVQGLGFGTSNQFLSWFGPSMTVSSCSESNAISYEKLDGSAYFGGTLNAGILTNSATASLLGATTSINTGPFTSNGGTRTVSVGLYLKFDAARVTTCPSSPVTPSATIALYRGATLLQTTTLYGTWYCADGTLSEPSRQRENFNTGFTFTDNSGGTSVSYSAVMTSRTLNEDGNPDIQLLSVISVEQ